MNDSYAPPTARPLDRDLSNRQIVVFTYHKTGTVLFEHIMQRVTARLGGRCVTRYGRVTRVDPAPGIYILAHSLFDGTLGPDVRGIRVVRDPRDIWVSGYLYHRRCNEGWCTNTDFRNSLPITYPRVDFSVIDRPEAWKLDYLRRLGGRSYQQNLLARGQEDGLAFELAGYTQWTLDAMRAWRPQPGIIDIRLEEIAAGFDAAMRRIFTHLRFGTAETEAALACAAEEDVARMDDATLAASPHISGRELSKWRRVLTPAQVAEFERLHGDVIDALGYQRATA